MNSVKLVNQCLVEIGKFSIEVKSLSDDIFTLDLSSIEQILLIAKIEEISNKKIEISKLGTSPSLTVGELSGALKIFDE